MDKFAETLGGLIFVGGAVLIVYFIAHYTYLIKKMLAEKDMLSNRTESRLNKLDVAYVVIGVGVGLLLASGLGSFDLGEDSTELLSWGIVLISGALGLIIASKQKK
ncbi:MAG: hypothetical protein MRZ79_27340 [Bacteroidia bacterium]|nr:hypothetical protein [Bacteroidia bacterium]